MLLNGIQPHFLNGILPGGDGIETDFARQQGEAKGLAYDRASVKSGGTGTGAIDGSPRAFTASLASLNCLTRDREASGRFED